MNDTSPSSSSTSKPSQPPYPPYPYPPYQIEQDEINLLDYLRVLVRYKVMIIGVTLISTVAAMTIAFLMTPIYRAEALLAPVYDNQQNSISTLASQFGGLASLAGINLGSSGSNTDQVLATLTSRNFITNFIKERHLIQVLFADRWDSTTKTWKVESSDNIPTVQDAYKLFIKNILSVTTNTKTGLVTISIEWHDPGRAAIWANELINRINHYEKQLAVNEAEKSIAYLKEQLTKTSVVEMQQVIYQLMEAQTKKIMLANVRDQYAFKVIDPAVVPEKRTKPNRKIITLLGLMLGLLASIIGAIMWSSLTKQKGETDLGVGGK